MKNISVCISSSGWFEMSLKIDRCRWVCLASKVCADYQYYKNNNFLDIVLLRLLSLVGLEQLD